MRDNGSFFRSVCRLAIPVALQSMLQSSFSMVDQLMIGQLGEVEVAAVGLAGKFASVYSVIISAVGAVAGIVIAQYLGQENGRAARRSLWVDLLLGAGIAAAFTAVCALFPGAVMGIYTGEAETRQTAAEYLRLISGTFLPMAGATLISTAFRCEEKPRIPLLAGILAALLNTGLNYMLIFGECGCPALGVTGAAAATVIAQWANCLLMALLARGRLDLLKAGDGRPAARLDWRQYGAMLLPLLACEVIWSLGENVYAVIYGRMGTEASAAMTLTNPIQGLVIGALCGLSQAAAVIVGKRLGSGDQARAYGEGKRLALWGAAGAVLLSAAVLLLRGAYVELYRVEDGVKAMTKQILAVYALIAPVKVVNMILGGGVLRSGGKTKYGMYIDLIGTWGFGVPLGLLGAFCWKLPIAWVYLLLSLEECIRLALTAAVFRGRRWMDRLEASERE